MKEISIRVRSRSTWLLAQVICFDHLPFLSLEKKYYVIEKISFSIKKNNNNFWSGLLNKSGSHLVYRHNLQKRYAQRVTHTQNPGDSNFYARLLSLPLLQLYR